MSYSADARKLAVNVYKNSDWSIEVTAKNLDISARILQKWLNRSKLNKSLEDKPQTGRPRRLSEEQVQYLVKLTQDHPDWIQQAYANALNERFEGLSITQPGVSHELKRARISLKKRMAC